jgi:stage V sporulation protein R
MRHPDPRALKRLDFIPFPEELVQVKREFLAYARGQGLDPGEIIFDFLTSSQVSEAAAYDGFPARYPHWHYGMVFDQMEKKQKWGLATIYEMVINNNPAFAYLLEGSTPVIQRMVIAHVLGHCDFFRRNAWFQGTNRNMLNEMANHAARIRRYADRHGFERVERFLDTCLSLENLVDPNLLFWRAKHARAKAGESREEAEESRAEPRFTSPYLSSYYRGTMRTPQAVRTRDEDDEYGEMRPFPEKPIRAVLDFLVDNAPLADWERDALDIIRNEAYYFLPQRLTKILNEGWAVFWHKRIMVARGLRPSDMVEYADEHSKIIAAFRGRINPYRLGYYLLEDIKVRWDKGRHGPDWEICQDRLTRERWDTREMKGMEKLLEVRAAYNDAQFVDEFMTPEFAQASGYFTYRHHPRQGAYVIESREFDKIKQTLLTHLTNGGEPILELTDANYANRSELYLRHIHGGVDLRIDEARQTLHSLYAVWRRPVNLETQQEGKKRTFSYDGQRDGES